MLNCLSNASGYQEDFATWFNPNWIPNQDTGSIPVFSTDFFCETKEVVSFCLFNSSSSGPLAPSLPGLSRAKRGTDGAGTATGAGFGACDVPELTSAHERVRPSALALGHPLR